MALHAVERCDSRILSSLFHQNVLGSPLDGSEPVSGSDDPAKMDLGTKEVILRRYLEA